MKKISPVDIANKLVEWHLSDPVQHPWKQSKNPYYIWLSEIIMQQTRIAQGTPYYLKFVQRFPKIEDLAAAKLDEILSMWQGLGYYSRARNLHHTAKHITVNLNGVFPTSYEEILKLKGVGPYTAAAISSFAYNLPQAVVDGNVIRVISRLHGITSPIDEAKTLTDIHAVVSKSIMATEPALFNQAIMDYGAQHCTPALPRCEVCMFSEECLAFRTDKVKSIPTPKKKIKRTTRYFHYFVCDHQGAQAYRKRQAKDIWEGLYEFPMLECKNQNTLTDQDIIEYLKISHKDLVQIQASTYITKQKLSHQDIIACFYYVTLQKKANFEFLNKYLWLKGKEYEDIGKPRLIDLFLKQNSITLFR